MTWSKKAWAEINPIYKQITQQPFVQELMNGTLSNEQFIFYIKQDALYLAEYGRVLMGIAAKLPKAEHSETFMRFAADSVAVENALHESFMEILGGADISDPSPSCLLYTSYLSKQLATAPVEVAAAAILPCFRIYKEVGDFILANQCKGENIYQSWIDTYGGEEFAESVAKAEAICDQLAANCTHEQQSAMTHAYVMCSKMEWMFWDSAYKLEKWSV